jgi:hypothetical protein
MIAGLGSIIDRVAGLFGKTYLLAGFFPVLLLAAVSLLAGYDTSEWIYRQVNAFAGLDVARQALASGALLVAVAMLGFVFWSANPWWRALLQGTALCKPIREWMAQDQQAQLDRLEKDLERWDRRVFAFRTWFPDPEPEPEPEPEAAPPEPGPTPLRLLERLLRPVPALPAPPPATVEPDPQSAEPTPWMLRLSAARAKGDALAQAPGVVQMEPLRRAYRDLRVRIRGLKPVGAKALDGLCTLLERELERAPVTARSELDRLHVGFYDLAVHARARVENARNRALSVRRTRFPLDLSAVGPTRMANVAELYRDHALTRYDLDPELLWLQLQHSAAKDEQFRPILEEARLKLDVSVALAVACGLASIWGLVVGVRGHSLPVLLLTGVGLPAAALLFYRATITNLRVYGEAVTATVQLFRFDVLKALHLPLPPDSDAERRLWHAVTLSDQLLGEEKVTYVHA